jgi:hypothetical protein
MLAKYAWSLGKSRTILCIGAAVFALMGCYAGLTVMKVSSKRSALGCVAPVFVLGWDIVALVPAAVHRIFESLRRRRFRARPLESGVPQSRPHQKDRILQETSETNLIERPSEPQRQVYMHGDDEHDNCLQDHHVKESASAVQGGDEEWPVQMAWSIYYIAGTLIFTSIMAVTVIELVVWVMLGLATSGCSKVLALFLCLAYEDTGAQQGDNISLVQTSNVYNEIENRTS